MYACTGDLHIIYSHSLLGDFHPTTTSICLSSTPSLGLYGGNVLAHTVNLLLPSWEFVIYLITSFLLLPLRVLLSAFKAQRPTAHAAPIHFLLPPRELRLGLVHGLRVHLNPSTPFREFPSRGCLRGLISLILVSFLAPSEVLPPCTSTMRACTGGLAIWLTDLSWWFFQSLLDASVLAVQSRLPILLTLS